MTKDFFSVTLRINDAGKQDPGRGDDGASRFEQELHTQGANHFGDHFCVRLPRRGLFAGVSNAEPAAKIEILQIYALFAQIQEITGQSLQRLAKWIKRNDL